MPITRTPIFDDTGLGVDGTIINNAWKQELYDQIDAFAPSAATAIRDAQVINTTQSGTVNDWNLGATRDAVVFWNGAADLVVTGIAGIPAGRQIVVINIAAAPRIVRFVSSSPSSASANRFVNTMNAHPTPIGSLGYVRYVSTGGNLLLINHQQGAWITLPYAAGNFTAAAGSWTMAAANQQVRYLLSGKGLEVIVSVVASSVSVFTVNLFVQNLPFTFVQDTFQPLRVSDNGTISLGMGQPNAGQGALAFWSNFGGAGWAAAAGTTSIEGHLRAEVS